MPWKWRVTKRRYKKSFHACVLVLFGYLSLTVLDSQNKEAEAKEELKRRAKQLEMQRREQQKRAASGGGSSYLGGGSSGYSPIPQQRFDAPESSSRLTSSVPTPSSLRTPTFKGSGMKLGAKKTKQAELIDALGGDYVATAGITADLSEPPTPSNPSHYDAPAARGNAGRGSIPEVVEERSVLLLNRLTLIDIRPSIHILIKEQLSLALLRDGGVQSMELKGDMNLNVSDPGLARLRLTLVSPSSDFGGSSLQFKQHPNVAKFTPGKNQERVVGLKDPSRPFPVNQSLAVLKWRYAGTDESNVPLSSSLFSSILLFFSLLLPFLLFLQSTAGLPPPTTGPARSVSSMNSKTRTSRYTTCSSRFLFRTSFPSLLPFPSLLVLQRRLVSHRYLTHGRVVPQCLYPLPCVERPARLFLVVLWVNHLYRWRGRSQCVLPC